MNKLYVKAKTQPKLGYDVTIGQQAQNFTFSNWLWEYEFLSLLTESNVIAKFGLFF